MSWCGSVLVYIIWGPLCFLYLNICFLVQIREAFSCNFFKHIFYPLLSLPLPDLLLWIDWHILYYPIALVCCFHFFHLSFYLLFRLGHFHYSIFQITYSSTSLSCRRQNRNTGTSCLHCSLGPEVPSWCAFFFPPFHPSVSPYVCFSM